MMGAGGINNARLMASVSDGTNSPNAVGRDASCEEKGIAVQCMWEENQWGKKDRIERKKKEIRRQITVNATPFGHDGCFQKCAQTTPVRKQKQQPYVRDCG